MLRLRVVPRAQAFAEGRDFITPVKPNTIAKSIAIGNPADGPYALDIASRTGGSIAAVNDEEIIEGIQLLAETEGVFTETCLLYTSPSPRDYAASRMPSSA